MFPITTPVFIYFQLFDVNMYGTTIFYIIINNFIWGILYKYGLQGRSICGYKTQKVIHRPS